MENLEKLIYDLYKKNARQCTNEEIYNALLIYTKNQLSEKQKIRLQKKEKQQCRCQGAGKNVPLFSGKEQAWKR